MLAAGAYEEPAAIEIEDGAELTLRAAEGGKEAAVTWPATDGIVVRRGTFRARDVTLTCGGRDRAVIRAVGPASCAVLERGCALRCFAAGSDASPYPKQVAACVVARQGARVSAADCSFVAASPLGRGAVCYGGGWFARLLYTQENFRHAARIGCKKR